MKLTFAPEAWEDYRHWQDADEKILVRINQIIKETTRTPFNGIGKPEPLKASLKGWWSRRITREHRMVYRVTGSGASQMLEIAQLRYHY